MAGGVDGLDTVAEHSEKGGVGKTSVTAGLAAVAAERGLRVGVVDLDPRCTLTDEMGVDDPARTVNDIYYTDPKTARPADPAELVHDVLVPAGRAWPSEVRVLPCERDFGNREADPTTGMEFRLKRALWGLRDELDLVLMDVPPRAGGKIAGSALLAAGQVLIPATLTTDGYEGAREAMRSIDHFAYPGGLNEDLRISGVVRSIVPRDSEMREIHRMWNDRIVEEFGDLVLPTQIRNYAVREVSRSACAPITSAPGREAKLLVDAYSELLDHILKHAKEAHT